MELERARFAWWGQGAMSEGVSKILTRYYIYIYIYYTFFFLFRHEVAVAAAYVLNSEKLANATLRSPGRSALRNSVRSGGHNGPGKLQPLRSVPQGETL